MASMSLISARPIISSVEDMGVTTSGRG